MERTFDGSYCKTVVASHSIYRRILVSVRIMAKAVTWFGLILFVWSHFKLGTSFHKTQTVRPAARPKQFFPSNSVVIDFPYGQLQPAITLLQEEEIIFLMYYAPWCAESVSIRNEFAKAAKVFQTTVKFIAINCWYTEGECQKTMKIYAFPDLYVYHVGIDEGYRFTGPKKAEYFVRFVESFIHPLQPLHSERQIQEFIARQDNTVIGYFDFNSSPQPPGSAFYQFYLAALRVMSYDFYQPVRFGVILVKRLARYFDIKTPERFIMARTGNTTLKYPLFYNMTCKNITNWIFYYRQQKTVRWLVPPGIKSLTLSLALKQGPSVVLFAPSNPMFDFNPYFEMLRIASLQFNSCGNYTRNFQAVSRQSVIQTILQLSELRQLTKKCRSASQSCVAKTTNSECCVSFLSGARASNSICEYCVQKKHKNADTVCDIAWNSLRKSELYLAQFNTCIHSHQNYNVNEHHSVSCKTGKSNGQDKFVFNNQGKKGRRPTDPYVIHGVESALKQKCNKFSLQKLKKLVQYENLTIAVTKHSDVSRNPLLTGYACDTNKTLNFYFVDSNYHSMFVERLGISVQSHQNRATVILVDLKNEVSYHLREEVNYANLVKFVTNYIEDQLERQRLSADISSPSECDPSSSSVCVTDVSTETFDSVVLDTKKDVVLLYFTPWCGFCSHFAHTFLAAAKYFSSYKDITFARIDSDVNDLPWELSVDKYPTVMFFPAGRKADSIKFPDDIPKSLPNLIKFILYHSTHQLQLDSAVSICSRDCIERNKKLVVEEIDRIQKMLKQLWRRLTTLTQHINPEHDYFWVARATVRQVYELQSEKLRKAQQLHYYLEKDIKRLSRLKL